MRHGISGASVPLDLLYAGVIDGATLQLSFSPLLTYAIAKIETIDGEVAGKWNATNVISGDGGHGLMQITPQAWWTPEMRYAWAEIKYDNPFDNCLFALKWFLLPAETFWSEEEGMTGEALARCIAAEYNAGRNNALLGHQRGDVGLYTFHEEGVSYSDHARDNYLALLERVTHA